MAELNVSRKSIKTLLSMSDANTKGKIYVIPDYQRPYKWDVEKCETLWIDLTNFYEECKRNGDESKEYFLGTIVTCNDDTNSKNIDVIDGQQRLTSLYLLMRAFYTKLEEQAQNDPDDDAISGLMQSLAPCIWNVDRLTLKVTDKTSLHIHSEVASDSDNDVFHHIISTGEYPQPINPRSKKPQYKTNYEANYVFFLNKYDEYKKNRPQDWKELCLSIIDRSIVLPIECTDIDSALTIFGTLNDRGLPLADSDIFKAELYKQCNNQSEKEQFSKDWKELDERVTNSGLTIDDIFRYYAHVIRGRKNDKTQEIGLRKFYAGEDGKFKAFKETDFFLTINLVADFWIQILQPQKDFDENINMFCTLEAKKYIQCLCAYPNDYWRYPTTVFYITHKDSSHFKSEFTLFLKQLLAFLFVKFVEQPSVNAIKIPIFNFCIEIANQGKANFQYNINTDFAQALNAFSFSKITKPMLLLNAYLYDTNQRLLPENMEIEHIFPQKWQNTNYNGWNINEAKTHLNMFGNKIIFEKKLNILAGNGYFGKKKDDYLQSAVLEVKALSNYHSDDWLKEDIEIRNRQITDRLTSFFINTLQPQNHIKEKVIIDFVRGEEYLKIIEQQSIDGKTYHLHIKYKNVNNATSMEIMQNTIPLEEKNEVFFSFNEAIAYIDKNFFMSICDKIKPQIDIYLQENI